MQKTPVKLPHLFFAVEGVDGAGKTSVIIPYLKKQIQKVFDEFVPGCGDMVVTTREPGGTPFAEKIRQLVLSDDAKEVSAFTQSLLMHAARREHCETCILPALQRGMAVITDRFSLSTYIYQNISIQSHRSLNNLSTLAKPKWVLFADVSPQNALERLTMRGSDDNNHFDPKTLDEFAKRRDKANAALRVFKDEFPATNVEMIDTNTSINDVKHQIRRFVENSVYPYISERSAFYQTIKTNQESGE